MMFREKLFKKFRLKVVIVIFLIVFVNSLSAVQITTDFYPKNCIPKEFYVPNNGDLTLVTLEEWPKDSTISVFETRVRPEPIKKLGTIQTLNENTSLHHTVYSIGYIPGERVKFTYKDAKKKLNQEVTIVPCPLCVSSLVDNAKIEAKISQFFSPINYTIEFVGFGKEEVLFMKSSSYDEHLECELHCEKIKKIVFTPGVINKKGGIAKISFKRATGEFLELEIPWGLEWLKYNLYMEDEKVKSIIEDERFLKQNPEISEYFNSKRR